MMHTYAMVAIFICPILISRIVFILTKYHYTVLIMDIVFILIVIDKLCNDTIFVAIYKLYHYLLHMSTAGKYKRRNEIIR